MMYWPVANDIALKDFLSLALVAYCSAELSILINFGIMRNSSVKQY